MTQSKMKVEIWSDVMCPFCYIAKRKFEKAVELFPFKDQLQIDWKSFQLNPEMVTNPETKIENYLVEAKGISLEEAKKMNEHVTKMAKQVGIEFKLSSAIVANSFLAHRFSHYAKSKGLQDAAEELLFKAYFTEGKNIAELPVLLELGKAMGMDEIKLTNTLQSDEFSVDVQQDIDEAKQLGVRGVPFFVFDRTYAVSGAQSSDTFLKAVSQSFDQWKANRFIENIEVKN